MRRRDSVNNPSKTLPSTTPTKRLHPSPRLPFAASLGERRTTAIVSRPPFLVRRSGGQQTPVPVPAHRPTLPRPSTSSRRPQTDVPTPPSARPPLRLRDHNRLHNVPLLTSTTSRSTVAKAAARMPVDRPRQRQPAPAVARPVNRTPITPKIAAKGPSPTTPLARRPQMRDDVSSSPAAFDNVTPRSGPRQQRVDSVNTTPSAYTISHTIVERGDGWDASSRSGLGTPSSDLSRMKIDSPAEMGDSKFFYASDAKTVQGATLQRPPSSLPQKPVTFFYANGSSADKRTTSPLMNQNHTLTPTLAPTPEPVATKFFYANGTPDVLSMRPPLGPSASPSIVAATSSRVVPTRSATTTFAPAIVPSAVQRPASPIKAASFSTMQTLKTGPMSTPSPIPIQQSPTVSSPPLTSATPMVGRRRVSVDAPPGGVKKGHVRLESVPRVEPAAVPRYVQSPNPHDVVSPPLSPDGLQQPMTLISVLQAADELKEQDEGNDDVLSDLQGSSKSAAEPISELIANARRERKVQDLEITNASLEAINRTLERQLRKQTAELRRFRRLSRSGRISLASGIPSRAVSDALTDPPVDLTDMMEDGDSEEDEDENDSLDSLDISSNDSMSADHTLSPDTRLNARRKREERRLQLDLTKHQELLVDSQKMNQSLKRCLDWTENLIKEGQKALEYHVRVSDVELGGRVLAPPDEDDEDSESLVVDATSRSSDSGLEQSRDKLETDPDSGVELPVDSF
ncbi:hypothetical protein DCS_04579 [Drechmeria coniospora]|uniref:Uncharacterized protein n=1 Tax=Drechmeria coniospora TaxID=98403 RepID=A0A151GKE7_DRECN|nr:hypothetical protein DCS_04579 [Drechmeria coniospora]KYK57568.1 hypothetical protein DCS_04579 [Drechmeria coniospora]ODA79459.1 hypothetical protein RJ55_05052 [Drechmeria coniospora]